MYILNPDILQFIPKNKSFDMTDLIKCLKEKKKKIGVYPISEKSWIDIGQWEKYRGSNNKYENLTGKIKHLCIQRIINVIINIIIN